MDNMERIISFSQNLLCKGLALGGKDSTSSHFWGKKVGGTFLRRESQLMAQVEVIGALELERGVLSLEPSVGSSADWCRWKTTQPWLVGEEIEEDREEEMGCVATPQKNGTVTHLQRKHSSWAIPNLYVRCSQWSICISRGENLLKSKKKTSSFYV